MLDRHDLPPTPTEANRQRVGGRFLILRLSALGDVLHALPAAAALRRERPTAQIDWIVEDRFAALLEGHPAVNRIQIVPRTRWRRAIRRPWQWPALTWEFGTFVLRLWARRYDAAIDLQGNAKSGLWSLCSGAVWRFGLHANDVREGNALLSNRHVRAPASARHRVERALSVVAAALGRRELAYAAAPLPRTPDDVAWVERTLAERGLPHGGFAVLHPGTSGFGAFKRWPAERFGELARRLDAGGCRVVVTLGPSEDALAAEVVRASGGTALAIAPPNLRTLAELVSRARVFVSADTGPLHVAAAEDVPVVCLFGPKDADVYGPYRPPSAGRPAGPGIVVTSRDVPCRPCALRRCPDPVCMTSMDVESVVEGVDRAIATM